MVMDSTILRKEVNAWSLLTLTTVITNLCRSIALMGSK